MINRNTSLVVLFVGKAMGTFPRFDQIIKIKAAAQPIDFIALFIDDVEGVIVGWKSGIIKIKCVSLVASGKGGVVELVAGVLGQVLRVGVVVVLVVAQAVHVVVRVGGVVLISLAGVFELLDFEGLLDQDVLHIIGQVVDLVFLGIVMVLGLGLP